MHFTDLFWPVLVIAALKTLSEYQLSHYSDVLDSKFKNYARGPVEKPTVVFVPGLDGATAFFTDIVPELTPTHHVVIFNLPLQDRKASIDYSFEYITMELLSVLDELNLPKVSLVGESFGGIIAEHFAITHPTRLNKLVLISSLVKTELPPEIQFKLDYLMPIISTFGTYFPHFAQLLFALIHVTDVVEQFESNFVRHLFLKEASFAHFFSVLARVKLAAKLDLVSQIPLIQTPALVVYGEDDHFTKKDSLQLHGLLPNSVLRGLPGGHLAHVTSPQLFAEIVKDFIAE
jgi:pimeloyl-ACP methyl ester carboxylesterase